MSEQTTAIKEYVMGARVFDTHTHLDTSQTVAAANVWDILHYFWFHRELCAAGYPEDTSQLTEASRREVFLAAFDRSRNTYWNTIVRRILSDLFDCRLETTRDFDFLEEKIRSTSTDPQWPTAVCDRIGVRSIVVGTGVMDVAPSFAERLLVVPSLSISAIMSNRGKENHDDALRAVLTELESLQEAGFRTIRVDLNPLLLGTVASDTPSDDKDRLYHSMLAALDQAGTRIQVFTGITKVADVVTMLDDPERIVRLYPVFDRYSNVGFELVNAAAGNNLDIVQAARVYTNVDPGGFWWFNFRASTYRVTLQQRFEALPTSRSCIMASDARCIEWLYGKVLFVKTVLADFLQEQIDRGWTDLEGAQKAADDWLFETATSKYSG